MYVDKDQKTEAGVQKNKYPRFKEWLKQKERK